MGFLDFIRTKHFWINLFIAGLLLFMIVRVTMSSLKGYTRHGKYIVVPDLTTMPVHEVDSLLASLRLSDTIIDSVYLEGLKQEVVVEQDPPPGSSVKENRKIYLTVNAKLPPKVNMPDLKDKSFRQALLELQRSGLRLGDTTYRHDLGRDVVLDQYFSGKYIEPGTLVPKGARISLVLGDGLGESKVDVPNLIGLTREEAKWTLKNFNLNIGDVDWDKTVKDSATAVIYKQVPDFSPDSSQQLNFGESVDIYLTQTLPDFLKQFSADSTKKQ
ncbi:MAG TPA: PASTA domain-containing protein [Chitinophagales bacterium]|nr:PASTA domain-containing protein [Chitinophagales bacterium]